MMPRSSSAEPAKSSKRKGTRSVSTLTPSQLARKRANDREAQRAIRARTKEHIERLERELDEYRGSQSRDKTVQELLRRNRALEDELRRLKDATMSASMTSSPYSAPAGTDVYRSTTPAGGPHALSLYTSLSRLTLCPSVYDDNLSVASTMPSPQMSPLPSGPDYGSMPDYPPQQYVSLPKTCESWASSVGSPCSSVNDGDYSSTPAYIPTSMPASMMHAKDVKMEFEDMHSMASQGYMHQHHRQQQQQQPPSHSSPHQPQQQQQRPQSWNIYPMYYDAASPTPCVSR